MDDNKLKIWDLRIKIIGIILTATSIFFGLKQVSRQQAAALDAERTKNFWRSQDDIYIRICDDAGAVVATVNNPSQFEAAKTTFLTHYYGETGLVDDDRVNRAMKEIHSQLIQFNPKDPEMVNSLKAAVFALADSCRRVSPTFQLNKNK